MGNKFFEYHKNLLGDKFVLLEGWMEKPQRKSLRVNVIRGQIKEMIKELEDMGGNPRPIPWCKEGFWISNKPWGATIPHQLGYFYLQEATSMAPAAILDAKKDDIVLDIAAAPGSKTTQIAPYCDTIIANEPDRNRRTILFSNINRCGITNAITTGFDGRVFPNGGFNKILVDVPCTEVGAIKKDKSMLKSWSINWVKQKSALQKDLLKKAFRLLGPSGELVYSTCTSTIEENEEVILALLDEYPQAEIRKISSQLQGRPGMLPGTEKCLRVHPWDNQTEFFFISKIKNG